MVISYLKLINDYETQKLDAMTRLGDDADYEFRRLDAKLDKLYAWLMNSPAELERLVPDENLQQMQDDAAAR